MGRTFDNSELQGSEERILDLSRDDAAKRFQHLFSIKEHLSQRWREEYVSQLRQDPSPLEAILVIFGRRALHPDPRMH